MMNYYDSVDTLVAGVKGTTGILSHLISRKSGLILLFVGIGALLSKLVFG
jgi:hypothetical protein